MSVAPPSVVWQIVGISLLMSMFSQWFSRRFKVSQETQMQTQMRVQDLQDQLKAAQSDYNQQLIAQINAEMMDVMKVMYKKQLLPMLIRSVVFFAIWGLMRLLYGAYDEFLPFNFLFGRSLFSLYLLVSFGFSAVLMIGRLIYRKIKPEQNQKEEVVIDKIRALQSNIIMANNDENAQNEQPFNSTASDLNNQQIPSKSVKNWKKRL